MSISKNNRNKARKRINKNKEVMEKKKTDYRQKQIEQQKKTALINQALAPDRKPKKNNQNLVEKFKQLFKRRIK